MFKKSIFAGFVTLLALGILNTLILAQAKVPNPDQPGETENDHVADTSRHGWLGIRVTDVPAAVLAQMPKMDQLGGAMVAEVLDDSPAQRAGLQPFDLITRVDESPVATPQSLIEMVRSTQPGDELTLTFLRHGKQANSQVTLEPFPADRFAKEPLELDEWPASRGFGPFGFRFNFPDSNAIHPDSSGTSWSAMQSVRISEDGNGQCSVDVEYRKDGNSIRRSYSGTRDEVLESIETDGELPDALREQIRNGLAGNALGLKGITRSLNGFRSPSLFSRPAIQPGWFNEAKIHLPEPFLRRGMIDESLFKSFDGFNNNQ